MSLNSEAAKAKILDAQGIAARIPHGESMSLLDRVESWDETQITCSTHSHLCSDNPFRTNSQLFSVSLIEYGAQAAAIHSSLLQSSMSNAGLAYLGAVKSLELLSEFVPQIDSGLSICATTELHNSAGAVYYFTASIQQIKLAQGKLVLVQPL